MKEKDFKPVNLWIACPLIMQIAIAAMMLWGFFGGEGAWSWSWLCSYIGVVLCIELSMYNGVIANGKRPILALIPIAILLGFAVFFTGGFCANGWAWSWIALAAAAVAVVIIVIIAKATEKKPEK